MFSRAQVNTPTNLNINSSQAKTESQTHASYKRVYKTTLHYCAVLNKNIKSLGERTLSSINSLLYAPWEQWITASLITYSILVSFATIFISYDIYTDTNQIPSLINLITCYTYCFLFFCKALLGTLCNLGFIKHIKEDIQNALATQNKVEFFRFFLIGLLWVVTQFYEIIVRSTIEVLSASKDIPESIFFICYHILDSGSFFLIINYVSKELFSLAKDILCPA